MAKINPFKANTNDEVILNDQKKQLYKSGKNELFGIGLLNAFKFMFAGFNVDGGIGIIGDLLEEFLFIEEPNFAVVNEPKFVKRDVSPFPVL